MRTLTARQSVAWPEAIARLQAMGANVSSNLGSWAVDFAEENRPGRGHFINATYVDGEVFAQILMDVYGYPTVSFANLNWVHADSDEECECDTCEAERAAEDGTR